MVFKDFNMDLEKKIQIFMDFQKKNKDFKDFYK